MLPLYDNNVTGSVSGTVTYGTNPIVGATVLMEGTSLSAVTGADGSYTISSVPDPVTYTVEAQAVGFESATIARLTVDGSVDDVDFTLTPKSDDDGGGPPPCKGKNKNDQGC